MILFPLRLLFYKKEEAFSSLKRHFHCHSKDSHEIKVLLNTRSPIYLLWSLT